jgi:serine/threonine-protein kinase
MAPEQFRSEGRVSPATDIYALGMLAYTLLVGVHYWSDEHERCENPFAFASVAVHGPKEPPSLRSAREDVELPPEFDTWFARATSRWPQDRFASATSAIVALAESLGVETPVVPLLSAPAPVSHVTGTDALAPTIESPSGRLSSPGSRTGSTGGLGARVDSGVSEVGREQHTEVSLSVTSGGAPLVAEEEPHTKPGRVVALVASVAIAAAVTVVGIGRYRASKETTRVEPPASSASTASHGPTQVATTHAEADQEPTVTSIEELPLAPPEPPADNPSRAADPGRRPPPVGLRKPRRPQAAERRSESSPSPSEPAAPERTDSPSPNNAPPAHENPPPQKGDRWDLYKMN